MHLEGSFETLTSRRVAYDFLLNLSDVAPCLPDLQSVDVLSLDSYRAKVKVGIGPVKVIASEASTRFPWGRSNNIHSLGASRSKMNVQQS
jgi:carbon monoxide dehydrogenase subunit G